VYQQRKPCHLRTLKTKDSGERRKGRKKGEYGKSQTHEQHDPSNRPRNRFLRQNKGVWAPHKKQSLKNWASRRRKEGKKGEKGQMDKGKTSGKQQ